MTGADAIAEEIVRRGIDEVFVYPGGTIAPTLEALRQRGITLFTARHEQGAGYAALAKARLTGRAQVVMVTSGPGVTNVLTSVADGYFDSTPLIVLSGQVGTADLRRDAALRQRGFQEVDAVSLARPISKAQLQPMSPDEAPDAVAHAFNEAESDRPGPVLLDLPMDVQRGEIVGAEARTAGTAVPAPAPDSQAVKLLAEWLQEASRPVIAAGQGVLLARAHERLREFASLGGGMPVTQSLLGLGAFPTSSPLALGFHGHTGNQAAGRAIHEADLVIALGTRLDVRQTGSRVDDFAPSGRVVRVDLDPVELGSPRVRADLAIRGDVRSVLGDVIERAGRLELPDWSAWRSRIEEWKNTFALEFARGGLLKPQAVIEAANELSAGREVTVTTGVGSHQQWAARHFDYDFPSRILLTSGGHGAMGYDLPSAIGAQVTNPDRLVICFAGDGSIQMNLQELATVVEYRLPVSIVVLDNRRLAMVSQFQNLNWGCDPTCGGKWNPDFAAVARAFGIEAATARTDSEVREALSAAFASDAPFLLHALVDPAEDVLPLLLPDQLMSEMWGA